RRGPASLTLRLGGEPAEDLRRALVDAGPGLPAQVDAGAARVEHRAHQLPGACGGSHGWSAHARARRHRAIEIVHRCLDTRADVEEETAAPGRGACERVGHVVDVDEIARLAAVAVDGARQPGEEPGGED